jgi:hypothetical protein
MDVRFLAFAIPLMAGASPAAAAEIRAAMAVTVEVVTRCVVGPTGSAATCSRPIPFQTTISAHPGEQPLAEAARILGAPERSDGGLRFGAPLRAASPLPAPVEAADRVTYRTISY